MITKTELKNFSSLLTKKYRQKENKFIIEGERSVLEGLNSKYKCEAVLISNKYFEENPELIESIKEKNQKVYILKSKEFQKISDTKSPQGIAGIFTRSGLKIEDILPLKNKIIVMLDNISDPGNLGTIIRNCDWFGIKAIILNSNTVDYTNPKVLRSSMGSIFHIDINEANDLNFLEKFKYNGYEILCADTEGENIFNYKSEMKKVIIFSSEAHGPSKVILNYIDRKITIPKIGKAESLNVASASAVILAELTK